MDQQQAFAQFLETHKQLIIKVAGIYCGDPEHRKDLVQDIILQLWKSFPAYNKDFALSTWMYRIALNVSISSLRKEATRKKTHEGLYQQGDLLYYQDTQLEERLQILYRHMEELKPLEKAMLILHLEGRKQTEIAEILGVTESNVSTKIHRIKTLLKSKIKNGTS
ncbi:MAG: sigma-70 family RNA polymerase sigma factor [Cyclobacteriaceae bacterium]